MMDGRMDAESAVVFPQQVTQQIPHGPVAVLTPVRRIWAH